MRSCVQKNTAEFLAVTKSDSRLEFLADPNSHLPPQIRDQRYCNATSQPYAASSYGISQVLPSGWNRYSTTYNQYLNISNVQTPIFSLLNIKQFAQTGIYLAASRLHQAEGTPSLAISSDAQFQIHWSNVFASYNSGGFGYTFNGSATIGIVLQGTHCFVPGAPADRAGDFLKRLGVCLGVLLRCWRQLRLPIRSTMLMQSPAIYRNASSILYSLRSPWQDNFRPTGYQLARRIL